MANNSLRQLSDALNMATAQLSGDPQRVQMALGMQQSRKLQQQENKLNQFIGENYSEKEQQLLYAVPFAERAKILMGSQKPESIEIKELVDENNAWIENITEQEWLKRKRAGTLPVGAKLQNLGTGTKAADSSSTKLEKRIQPLVDQFRTGTNLIKGVSKLANDIATNPEVANTLVASGANAVQFLKSNLEGFVNIGSKNKDNPIYQNLKKQAVSLEGKDFTDEIKRVSGASVVTDSQILDLAFLFAAARGQEGKGLSDRDFQNALDILSKGVNAEQKIAVMKDVARRVSSEYITTVDIARKINSDDEEFLNKINEFETLPVFADPFAQQTPSTTTDVDELVNKWKSK